MEDFEKNAEVLTAPTIFIPPAPLPEWPADGFEQIRDDHQSVMPSITEEQIEHYFITRQLNDKQSCSNVKALELGKELLKAQRVRAISINIQDAAMFFLG